MVQGQDTSGGNINIGEQPASPCSINTQNWSSPSEVLKKLFEAKKAVKTQSVSVSATITPVLATRAIPKPVTADEFSGFNFSTQDVQDNINTQVKAFEENSTNLMDLKIFVSSFVSFCFITVAGATAQGGRGRSSQLKGEGGSKEKKENLARSPPVKNYSDL